MLRGTYTVHHGRNVCQSRENMCPGLLTSWQTTGFKSLRSEPEVAIALKTHLRPPPPPSDRLLPARAHTPKVLQLPNTGPATGDQVLKSMNLVGGGVGARGGESHAQTIM